MTINIDPDYTVASSLLEPSYDWDRIEREEVEVRRLDELFDEIVEPVPDPHVFLKIDTQGYDLEVFGGATGCIDRITCLQSELSVIPHTYEEVPGYLEPLRAYEDAGFELFDLSVVSRGQSGELLELNCIMRRADSSQGPG
jgi:Methyltransferase FkbM domain